MKRLASMRDMVRARLERSPQLLVMWAGLEARQGEGKTLRLAGGYVHTHARTHAHTHAHARTHARTHAHTDGLHIELLIYALLCWLATCIALQCGFSRQLQWQWQSPSSIHSFTFTSTCGEHKWGETRVEAMTDVAVLSQSNTLLPSLSPPSPLPLSSLSPPPHLPLPFLHPSPPTSTPPSTRLLPPPPLDSLIDVLWFRGLHGSLPA